MHISYPEDHNQHQKNRAISGILTFFKTHLTPSSHKQHREIFLLPEHPTKPSQQLHHIPGVKKIQHEKKSPIFRVSLSELPNSLPQFFAAGTDFLLILGINFHPQKTIPEQKIAEEIHYVMQDSHHLLRLDVQSWCFLLFEWGELIEEKH